MNKSYFNALSASYRFLVHNVAETQRLAVSFNKAVDAALEYRAGQITENNPLLIALDGASNIGKSTFAKAWGETQMQGKDTSYTFAEMDLAGKTKKSRKKSLHFWGNWTAQKQKWQVRFYDPPVIRLGNWLSDNHGWKKRPLPIRRYPGIDAIEHAYSIASGNFPEYTRYYPHLSDLKNKVDIAVNFPNEKALWEKIVKLNFSHPSQQPERKILLSTRPEIAETESFSLFLQETAELRI
jgi:hypothetical protein